MIPLASCQELSEALQSLIGRSLIIQEESYFTLAPLVTIYLKYLEQEKKQL